MKIIQEYQQIYCHLLQENFNPYCCFFSEAYYQHLSVLVLSPLRSNSQVVIGAVNDGDNFLSNFLYLSPA